ncbi:CheR family methyltransferase [Stakelama marina]|uniref:Chemotaxis protein methyltransferase n=1 Tax=Stakelama marina TaxID=2826939 RepID=A0A8T4IFE5_9SPHN|nr:CheR family methyltransferase [Stakelama marina]MBR0550979.1 methyltransferase domain-containing protein [Stakelama marina]
MGVEHWSAARAQPMDDTLSLRDFRKIAASVNETSGIKLPDGKRMMLEGRVRKRALQAGFASIAAYCGYLFNKGGLAEELPYLVDVATTNKTDFFREPDHFTFLERTAVPALLACDRPQPPRLKMWSAASSNGAEIYTIAMVLADMVAAGQAFDWHILGTDLSASMIADAKRAVYSQDVIAPVPDAKQSRYVMFARAPGVIPKVRIAPELRCHTEFRTLNLMDKRYNVDRDFDVIFLRNVLIYFEPEDQEAVVMRLRQHLRPGGYLVLGHAESMVGTRLGWSQVAPAVFQEC